MASPQTENGFTRLADELLDALIHHPFTKRQYKLLLAVIRKTYGYQKKEDDMTASQLADMTGLNRANVIRAINQLVRLRVLNKRAGHYGQVLGVNKDYAGWVVPEQQRCRNSTPDAKTAPPVVPEQHQQGCRNGTGGDANMAPSVVPKQHRQGCQNDTGSSAKMAPTIDNDQKTILERHPPPPQERAGEASPFPPVPLARGGGEELIFPREMTGAELREARSLVRRAGSDGQAVLDVLQVAIQSGEIRKSRLAVLSGLIRRYQAGSFDPAPGLHLAERRRRATALQAAQQRRQQEYAQELEMRVQASKGEGPVALRKVLKRLNKGRVG